MANFQTHLLVAGAASMFCGTLLYGAELASSNEALIYIFLGTLGGLLPDIDSDQSVVLKMIFEVFSAIAAFTVMFGLVRQIGILYALLLWLFVYLGVRHGVLKFFSQVTVHRGIIHSLPMGGVFGLGTILLAVNTYGWQPASAWMAGAFIFGGFIIHLLLDECYSVDLMGVKLKNSFGTALTIMSFREPFAYLALYLLVGVLFVTAPSPDAFAAKYFTDKTLHALWASVFP